MNLLGKIDRILRDGSDSVVSFVVPSYQAKELAELDKTKEYTISVTELKAKRSSYQNKYLWMLIDQIAKHEGMTSMEVYAQIIKMANIRTEFVQAVPEALERLSKVFRVVVEVERRTSPKGTETVLFQCYYGTSQFEVGEMSEFIDRMLEYGAKIGLDMEDYNEVWK